jgi:hypothetical protein
MCIVADKVDDVSKTKIASFHVAYKFDDTKTIVPAQLVVYSANVESPTNTNAFILPVYNPGNNPYKIIPLDFSKLPNFFIDVEHIYDKWFPSMLKHSYNMPKDLSVDYFSLIPVHKVGDYKFSIMPSKVDFNRLDKSQLNVNSAAKTTIDAHSNDYSFIIYQFFQTGKIEITPFGYLCESYGQYGMIIPTIHGHLHNTLPQMRFSYNSDFEREADFDHEIYALIKTSTQTNKNDIIDFDDLLKNIQTDYMQRKIRIFVPKEFSPKKITITGRKQNKNLLIRRDGYVFINDLII